MSTALRFPTGLYGITPDWEDFNRLYLAIEQACAAGLPILQWRRKHTPFELACEQAQQVAKCCHNHGTTFVVNDDWKLAVAVRADAVHIGKDDGDLQAVKKSIAASGHPLRIGVSCYNQLALAEQAILNGVDYFAFGAVFASTVKPNAVHAPLSLFQEAQQLLSTPEHRSTLNNSRPCIVGIGGITLKNAQMVIQAGADSIAVISGLFETEDIYQTCKDFMKLFSSER